MERKADFEIGFTNGEVALILKAGQLVYSSLYKHINWKTVGRFWADFGKAYLHRFYPIFEEE